MLRVARALAAGFSLFLSFEAILTLVFPIGGEVPFSKEASAIRAMQQIHSGEAEYLSQHGRYTASLRELGLQTADIVHENPAESVQRSYCFVLTATTQGYTTNAKPVAFGATGSRTFYSDQSMSIRYNAGQEPAGPTSPELK